MESTWYEGFRKRRHRRSRSESKLPATKESGTLPPATPSARTLVKTASEPALKESSPSPSASERQYNACFMARLNVADLQRETVRHLRDIDDVEFWGAKGIPGFRTYLTKKFGSLTAGWRALDIDGNGRLSFNEFCIACRKMGYHGNLKKLWRQLDENCNGFVSLTEIDEQVGQMLGKFKLALMNEYGDMLTAWRKGLDTNGSGRIEEAEIASCCKRLGLNFNSKRLFDVLRTSPNGKGVTLAEFDADAARRWYSSDFKGLISGKNKEFVEDITGIGTTIPYPADISSHPVKGGALAWRRELEARDRAEVREAIEKNYSMRCGLHTKSAFKSTLKSRCGSLLGAWREALDLDGNGRLTFGEFCQALHRLGLHGEVKRLWEELDKQGKGYLLFGDLDKDTDAALTEFQQKLIAQHGNLLMAWIKDLDTGGTGCVSSGQFQRTCQKIGFSGDAKKTFQCDAA